MARRRSRFKKMESYMTLALGVNAVVFVAFLIFAGLGISAMKILTAIISIGISGVVLYQLFMSQELLRRRAIWMTLAAGCIILCVLVSLILKFPSPPYTIPQI